MKMVTALGYYVVFVMLLITISLWELHEAWIKNKSLKQRKTHEKEDTPGLNITSGNFTNNS
ncbi:hypothetical protein [Adhaeribacter rhizoryzae]|uniref:hypothetical protein n=1 Tax=Adhaeribacter rhizoryzae TaxID=2607907 RepID=UPI0012322A74|nr:hypothetical protein [Adhaeribacter rhizoryzae]